MPGSLPPIEALVSCIERHRPDAKGEISLAPIPTGKFNDSFFVLAGNQELVLRVAPTEDSVFVFNERNMMHQEPSIHKLLRTETTVPVAEVYAFDYSHADIDRDFLLLERLPGLPMCDLGKLDEDAVLRQVGESLAQVHGLRAEKYGYLGEHSVMDPQSSWVDAFQVMWTKLVDDVMAAGYYDESEKSLMLKTLDRYVRIFDRPVPSCLLHMDVWAQNIMVDRGSKLTGLLDWDRALWGDPEIEFAVLDYCGVSVPAFWEGYGQEREESPEAEIRNIFYLLYEVQKYIVIRHGRRRDPLGASQYKRQVMDMMHRLTRGGQ